MQEQIDTHRVQRPRQTIPNPIGTAKRPMKAAYTNKKSSQEIATSKQRLRSFIYRASNQMNACSGKIPSQVHMAQSGQSRRLQRMATCNQENVNRYYPETNETPKGHLNQTQKNLRSTKQVPFQEADTKKLFSKK